MKIEDFKEFNIREYLNKTGKSVLAMEEMVNVLNAARENGEFIYINHPSAGNFYSTDHLTLNDICMRIFKMGHEEYAAFREQYITALKDLKESCHQEEILDSTFNLSDKKDPPSFLN